MVSPTEECGMNEARDKENNVIIIKSAPHNILPPQLKKVSAWYKVDK